jgi:preprotein translocase subunit SecY
MIESLIRAWHIPEVKRRLSFNLAVFAIFVLGVHIPVPGVDHARLEQIFGQGGFFGLMDVFSGGALRKMSIFAMGITPYINASIIMQMLTLALPNLEQMQKEGEAGRKRIAKITRYLTIGLSVAQGIGFSITFRAATTGLIGTLQMILMMVAGTCLLLWIGEQISEKGVGNGISLVIFAGIMTSMPDQLGLLFQQIKGGLVNLVGVGIFVALFVGSIYGIVMVTQGTRRIPISHSKRVVGMRSTQAGSSYLPIKVNTAGVIPIIFAVSILMFPAQLMNSIPAGPDSFVKKLQGIANALSPGATWYSMLVYTLLIFIFTYFYTSVVMNIQEMSDNLRKQNNVIPGIRPGKPTAEYLERVISRVTFAGAVFLALVALVQYIGPALSGVTQFSLLGGTSLLIVVGVAIETMQAIEAQLLMRNYEGFIKGGGQ